MAESWRTQQITVISGAWTQVNAQMNAGSATIYNKEGTSALRISPDSAGAEEIRLPPGGQQVFGDAARKTSGFQFIRGQPMFWLRSVSGTYIVDVVML